jgi:hypothetical protein
LQFEEELLQALKKEPFNIRTDVIRLDLWIESKINGTDYSQDFYHFLNQ